MSSLSKVVSLSATDGPTDWPTKQKEKVERGDFLINLNLAHGKADYIE